MKTVTVDHHLETLRKAHESLDSELHSLTRRAHLTPAEQQRARVIKKEKLKAKDDIRVLMEGFKIN